MPRRGRPKHPDILTPREWEVLDLLREGLTNEQIAERLGFTLHAARYHVSEILSKLGVSSREEAARWQPESLPADGRERRRWWSLAAPVTAAKALGVAVVAAALVGLGVLALGVLSVGGGTEGVGDGSPLWQPGQVIHTVMENDGVSMVGAPLTSEHWTLVGEGDNTELSRILVTDTEGSPVSEGFSSAVDQATYSFVGGETLTLDRPEYQSVFMWTESTVEEELLAEGYVRDGSAVVAGFVAHVYTGEFGQIAKRERSVYISADPYGLDLGEEITRRDSDGNAIVLLSRKLIEFEVVELDEAPPGVFDWPY